MRTEKLRNYWFSWNFVFKEVKRPFLSIVLGKIRKYKPVNIAKFLKTFILKGLDCERLLLNFIDSKRKE